MDQHLTAERPEAGGTGRATIATVTARKTVLTGAGMRELQVARDRQANFERQLTFRFVLLRDPWFGVADSPGFADTRRTFSAKFSRCAP